jgi:hypothetical protein
VKTIADSIKEIDRPLRIGKGKGKPDKTEREKMFINVLNTGDGPLRGPGAW